jgi:hypothetical protein
MPFGLLLPLRIAQFVFSIVVLGLSAYGKELDTKMHKIALLIACYSFPLVRCRHFDNLSFSDQLLGLCTNLLFLLHGLP